MRRVEVPKKFQHSDEQERAFPRPTFLGSVFEFHFLLPEFTILGKVMLPMRALGRLSPAAMRELVSQRHKTVVAVTHDLAMASRMDREIVLMDGAIDKVVDAQR